jgi:hypothetical protein
MLACPVRTPRCSTSLFRHVADGTSGDYWLRYLDEFVFRFNRRRTRHAAFDTLLGIGARTTSLRVLIREAA